jgi:ATP sulfurylase
VAGKPQGSLGIKRKTLIQLISDDDVKKALKVLRDQLDTGSPKDRITCATYLLDQRFGRPRQAVEHSGIDGETITHTVEVVVHGANQ